MKIRKLPPTNPPSYRSREWRRMCESHANPSASLTRSLPKFLTTTSSSAQRQAGSMPECILTMPRRVPAPQGVASSTR